MLRQFMDKRIWRILLSYEFLHTLLPDLVCIAPSSSASASVAAKTLQWYTTKVHYIYIQEFKLYLIRSEHKPKSYIIGLVKTLNFRLLKFHKFYSTLN